MEEIILEADSRQDTGRSNADALRRKGFIPAVVYGEGKKAQAIQVSHSTLLHLLHQYRLENAIINLKIKGDASQHARPCLIKEIQHDPVRGSILHVDFNEISLTKPIKVNVPVVAKGEPAGVKQEGGSLEHILWEVEVECLPTDIPKEITVDVSLMKIGDSVQIKDLPLPPNVVVTNDPNAVALSVAAPMKEEVPAEAVEGEEMKEPEVIKEKKEVPAEGEEGEDKVKK